MVAKVSSDVYNKLSLLSTFIKHSVDEIFEGVDLTGQDQLLHSILQAVRLHYEYVDNLARYLSEKISWDPPSYTRCAFGRIYYSLDPSYINSKYGDGVYDLFKRIENAHIEFHKTGENILDAYKTGNTDKMNQLIFELTAKSRMLIQLCKSFVKLMQEQQ